MRIIFSTFRGKDRMRSCAELELDASVCAWLSIQIDKEIIQKILE